MDVEQLQVKPNLDRTLTPYRPYGKYGPEVNKVELLLSSNSDITL